MRVLNAFLGGFRNLITRCHNNSLSPFYFVGLRVWTFA